MERISSYVIPVKLEEQKGKYLLIQGYTGAIDIVNENIALKLIEKNEISENDFSPVTFQLLRQREYITSKTPNEEVEYVARIVNALHRKAQILHKSFTFIITYNCNFRCPYCFEGRSMKDNESHQHISKEMVDYAYAAMEKIEPCEQLRNKNILLYGGEPLLAENRKIIEYILYEGKKRGYKFKAITNGYDLDSFIDLLSPELINDIQITIDGTKDYHNKRRIHYKNLPTFDKIIDNIGLALKTNIKISVRVNNDNKNLDDFLSLKEYFRQCGFFNFPSFNVYSSLLWNSNSISENEKQQLDFSTSKQYILKHKEMNTINYCKDYGVFYAIHQALTKGKPIPFKNVFCSSQAGEYVFDPLGCIYPCLEVVGDTQNLIGYYGSEKIKWNQENLEKWRNYDITHNALCHSCKYALLCGGGCVAHAMCDEREHCAYFRTMFNISVNRAFKEAFK